MTENIQQYDNGKVDEDTSKLEATETGLALVLSHCANLGTTNFPQMFKAVTNQGTLTPDTTKIIHKPGDPMYFEYAEHRFLGDLLELPEHNNASADNKSAAANPFQLPNGLSVTYGQINGLAGDFFGTSEPISEGEDNDRRRRFKACFDLLAVSDAGKAVAMKLIEALKEETDAVDAALKDPKHPSITEIYKNLPDKSFDFDEITKQLGSGELNYIDLAKQNFDHFGENAMKAYNAGHAWALEVAHQGTIESLQQAYAINAFADHFLEDSFASGHLRVPRHHLADGIFQNACAKLMHDEENRLAVSVTDPSKTKTWLVYGDKYLFDDRNKANLEQSLQALRHSVAEIYQAYLHPHDPLPNESAFQAWTFAPSLNSAKSREGNFAPLFMVVDGQVYERSDTSTTIDQTDRETLSQGDAWEGYAPVVSRWSLSSTVSWAVTAYKRAPDGTIKDLAWNWLKAHVPGWPWF